MNRIDKYHLSQSALVTLLASDWTTSQCHYMPTLEDCKPQIVTEAIRRKNFPYHPTHLTPLRKWVTFSWSPSPLWRVITPSCWQPRPGLSPLRQSRAPNRASPLQKAQTDAACARNHCRISLNPPHSTDHSPNRFAPGWQDARGTSSFHVDPGIWFRQACASERLGLSI